VTGVMLPGASAAALPTPFHIRPVILTVDVPVNIGIAVDVNVDIPAVPVAPAPGIPPGRPQCYSGGKGKGRRGDPVPGRIIRIGGIGGIGPGAYTTVGL
jgi:hypothetical protein